MAISSYEDFNRRLNDIRMNSTYKGVFLYALTDMADYDDRALVGRGWIRRDGDFWIVNLAFPAIRFLWYYWKIFRYGIFHMPQKQADSSDPQNDTLNVFKIIREQSDVKKIPDLKSLANRQDLYSKIIKESIKKEMLPHIVNDFDDSIITEDDQLKLSAELVDVIRKNRDRIRNDIESLMSKHLNRLSENDHVHVNAFEDMGPFSRFFMTRRDVQIFLACVDGAPAGDVYNRTMNEGVTPDSKAILGTTNVKLWGLRSTAENRDVWMKIRPGDFVLFVCNWQCFSKGCVQETVEDAMTAEKIWPADEIPRRNLLIIFESIQKFDLDLTNPALPGLNPTVRNQYNFPIIKANDQLSKYLSVMRDVGIADEKQNLEKIDMNIVRTETNRRRGQEKFREMVLNNYYSKCAVCKIDDPNLLQAAHIRSVRHRKTSGDLDNGICLCVLHHKMFDVGYLYFDEEYNAHLADKVPISIKTVWRPTGLDKSSCKRLPSKEHLHAHRKAFSLPEITNRGNAPQ